jgi:CBS-domain-containing membrane protein
VAQLSTLGVSTTFIFMTRYFIAANVWLALAIVAILGCTNRSTEHYAMSSFFSGPAIGASSYTFIEFVLFALSAFFFVLTWMTRKKS